MHLPPYACMLTQTTPTESREEYTNATALLLIDVINDFEFEGLICDIGLPDGSGLDLAAEARSRQPWKRMVALTGRERDDEKERGLAVGFDAYLTKPFDLHELRTIFAERSEASRDRVR